MLKKSGLETSKVGKTLIRTGGVLSKHNGILLIDGSLYRTIVGALHYYVLTRFEISFFVDRLCQFLHQPIDAYWLVV